MSDIKPPAKRPKPDNHVLLKVEFDSTTCESTRTKEDARAIRNMTVDVFVDEYVLGGLPTTMDPNMSGHTLRQAQSRLWKQVHSFWGRLEVQHLAGVLALLLNGSGHGHMVLLVRDRYGACSGCWDMMAVWAAKKLNMFPPRFVSTLACLQRARNLSCA